MKCPLKFGFLHFEGGEECVGAECMLYWKCADGSSERRCPGYDPENHRCNYHAQDFELNHQTVSRLKRENAGLRSERDQLQVRVDELERENAKLSSDELYLRSTLVDMEGKAR